MKFGIALLVIALLALTNWLALRTVPGFADDEQDIIVAAQTASEDAGSQPAQNARPEPETALDARQPAEGSPVDDPCNSDCAARAAGYAWAEQRGMSDPDECDGDSLSFVEGCRAYAEERLEQALLER